MTALRTTLLSAAALMLFIGAFGTAFVIVPDLRGDLIEIGVRRSVLLPTVYALYANAMTGFAFAVIVSAAAFQSARRGALPIVALAAIAAVVFVEGVMRFSQSHNPHHFAPIVMGALIAAALLVPRR